MNKRRACRQSKNGKNGGLTGEADFDKISKIRVAMKSEQKETNAWERMGATKKQMADGFFCKDQSAFFV